MRESLDEPVSVVSYYRADHRYFQPLSLRWRGHEYRLGSIDFHHKTWAGTTLIHHFSLADTAHQLYVKLAFNTTTLQWTIEEYMFAGDVMEYGHEAA